MIDTPGNGGARVFLSYFLPYVFRQRTGKLSVRARIKGFESCAVLTGTLKVTLWVIFSLI